ncbi:COMM domain-containing protein 6 [Pipistrellus kuhlii]|nr:COMM domain-containing protein 6 [Pipistrellus kuhlii]
MAAPPGRSPALTAFAAAAASAPRAVTWDRPTLRPPGGVIQKRLCAAPPARCVRQATRAGKRKRKCGGSGERRPGVRCAEPWTLAMEGSREPLLDAKDKVTNQLVDFQWKLGMAVSSDSCRSLKYPYVAVMLKVADHSGQVKTKSFEMTIPQFQNFYRQFKEIAAIIETV